MLLSRSGFTRICRDQLLESMNTDVARAGFYAHGGSSASHFSGDVVAVERALHGHLGIGMHVARAGGGVESKSSVAGPEFNGAGAGFKFPIHRRGAGDFDVARPGAGAQTALDVVKLDGAGAGLRLHIACACLRGEDIAGTGFPREAAMKPCGVDGSRAGGDFRVIADTVIVDVAGTGA